MRGPEHQHLSIGLCDIGEQLPLSLLKLCRTLNRQQNEFRFRVVGCITPEVLGRPDVRDIAYSATRLHELLRNSGVADKCDYLVGVTHVQLAAKPPGSRKFDIPYFSLSDFSHVAVISVHDSVAQCRGPTVNLYQYVAHLLVCELLILIAQVDLSHTEQRRCLFDDCVNLSDLRYCIDSASICTASITDLKKRNVSDARIHAAQMVLRWCSRNLLPFVVRFGVTHPVSTFCMGSALGWYLSAALTINAWWAVLGIALIPPFAISCYARLAMK